MLPATLLVCLSAAPRRGGLGCVVKSAYGARPASEGWVEPHLPFLLVAVGVTDGDLESNLRHNSVAAAQAAAEAESLAAGGRGGESLQAHRVRAAEATAAAAAAEAEVPGRVLRWVVQGQPLEGRAVSPPHCTAEGEALRVTLEEQPAGGAAAAERVELELPCRSVRRGLFELTAQHRRRFLEVVKELYSTPTEVGRRRYGERYLSMKDVWAAHSLLGAGGAQLLGGSGRAPTDLLASAGRRAGRARPYRRRVSPQLAGGAENVWLEVDGDANEYTPGALLFGAPAAELEGGPAAGFADATSVVLHSAAADGVTPFGAAALLFEAAVHSVDPAVAVPYFDEAGDPEGSGHAVPVMHWSDDAPQQLPAGGDSAAPPERVAYLPVFTDTEERGQSGGGGTLVHKGFIVPLVAHRPAGEGGSGGGGSCSAG